MHFLKSFLAYAPRSSDAFIEINVHTCLLTSKYIMCQFFRRFVLFQFFQLYYSSVARFFLVGWSIGQITVCQIISLISNGAQKATVTEKYMYNALYWIVTFLNISILLVTVTINFCRSLNNQKISSGDVLSIHEHQEGYDRVK